MSKLIYTRERWEGTIERDDGETIHIHLWDSTLQTLPRLLRKHLCLNPIVPGNARASPTHVQAHQFQAWQHLLELEPWLTCTDPDVRILCTFWHNYASRSSRTPYKS